ncbi:MAG TPA: discoidin domain-containing protein [Polyangiaceae bacterium]|nr:discoidin domain-containing protein [Polyangiaceae bacterium]
MSPSRAVHSALVYCLLGLSMVPWGNLACSSAESAPCQQGGGNTSRAGTPPAGASSSAAGGSGGAVVSADAGAGGSVAESGGGNVAEQNWTLPADAKLASCIPANWTVKASSSAQGNPPEYALDDVGSTRWSSGTEQSPGTFYEIDFGGWVTIDKLVLDNSSGSASDYPRGYEVRASKDGVNFARIPSFGWLDFAPTNGLLTLDFDPVPLQALQIATTEHALSWWSIHELRLGCKGADDGVPPVDPLACTPGLGAGGAGSGGSAGAGSSSGETAVDPFDRASWTVSASSTAVGDSLQGAIDGSIATRWSTGTAQTGGEWFQVELGAVGCISSVYLVSGGGDAAIGFTIEVSLDGVSYEQVAKGAGNAVDHIQFKPHSARYIRVSQRGAGGAHWWSIQEIEAS